MIFKPDSNVFPLDPDPASQTAIYLSLIENVHVIVSLTARDQIAFTMKPECPCPNPFTVRLVLVLLRKSIKH